MEEGTPVAAFMDRTSETEFEFEMPVENTNIDEEMPTQDNNEDKTQPSTEHNGEIDQQKEDTDKEKAQNKENVQCKTVVDGPNFADVNILKSTWTCQHCKKENNITRAQKKEAATFSFVSHIMASNKTCFEYTGIPNTVVLKELFDWIKPATEHLKSWQGRNKLKPGRDPRGRKAYKMSPFKSFLLTLVRIRKGFDTCHMSYLFGISPSHASRIFTSWVNRLDQCLQRLLKWPSQEVAKENLPTSFSAFPRTRCIIDCTEFAVEKPFQPAAQKQTWSSYKHGNPAKLLVGNQPCGTIIFLSKVYVGSISDAEIVKKSQFLDLIERGDDVMADRGFNIRHLLLQKGATLNIPAYSKGKNLSQKAVTRSRRIATVRIHVERAIRRMKCFKILSGVIPLKVRFSLNQILTVVSVLSNFDKHLCK